MAKISRNTRDELIDALKQRYSATCKPEKALILDKFVALTGFHRKHAIRVLSGNGKPERKEPKTSRNIYNEAVRPALYP
ncbi:MAG: hypothetical protein ACOCVH_03050 [Verrucomicrobiota bacterium]